MKTAPRRLLPLSAVLERIPIGRPTLDRLEARDEFPRRRHVGKRVFWLSDEIDSFVKNPPAEQHVS